MPKCPKCQSLTDGENRPSFRPPKIISGFIRWRRLKTICSKAKATLWALRETTAGNVTGSPDSGYRMMAAAMRQKMSNNKPIYDSKLLAARCHIIMAQK